MKTVWDAQKIIREFGLAPLPSEGGFYREVFRSDLSVETQGYRRRAQTAIYFLITPNDFSALHRVKHDEIFHFYAGDPVSMVQITPKGELTKHTLGIDFASGERPQVVVPRGVWQGCQLKEGGRWALLGCTVAPGFEFEDFELGDRDELIRLWPQHQSTIEELTRVAP